MNRTQMLLLKLMEECNEVSQRCSKAIRFGLDEVQPGQEKNNEQRIVEELLDLFAVLQMLAVENILTSANMEDDKLLNELSNRSARIDKYLNYSKELGILKETE